MASVQNDPKASGGHSDTPTPTGAMWSSSFPKVGGNTNGAKK
jgi:hypothetical protein